MSRLSAAGEYFVTQEEARELLITQGLDSAYVERVTTQAKHFRLTLSHDTLGGVRFRIEPAVHGLSDEAVREILQCDWCGRIQSPKVRVSRSPRSTASICEDCLSKCLTDARQRTASEPEPAKARNAEQGNQGSTRRSKGRAAATKTQAPHSKVAASQAGREKGNRGLPRGGAAKKDKR